MSTRFRAEEPGKHEYSLTMTMTLETWIKLKDQLCAGKHYASWPGSDFVREIEDMIVQAQHTYYPGPPKPTNEGR